MGWELVGVLLLLAGFAAGRMHRAGGGLRPGDAGAQQRAAGPAPAERPDVRFADVAGCEDAVDEIREFAAFLRDPAQFARLGAHMPSGLVLHGPPGTGKTLLAKALAGESGVEFFAASGSDFMDRYVGVGASRVRELFTRARRSAQGAVVFIDELDAIGKRRSAADDAGNSERDHTLNQLLVELDGFRARRRVVCVAATIGSSSSTRPCSAPGGCRATC